MPELDMLLRSSPVASPGTKGKDQGMAALGPQLQKQLLSIRSELKHVQAELFQVRRERDDARTRLQAALQNEEARSAAQLTLVEHELTTRAEAAEQRVEAAEGEASRLREELAMHDERMRGLVAVIDRVQRACQCLCDDVHDSKQQTKADLAEFWTVSVYPALRALKTESMALEQELRKVRAAKEEADQRCTKLRQRGAQLLQQLLDAEGRIRVHIRVRPALVDSSVTEEPHIAVTCPADNQILATAPAGYV